MYRRAPAQGRAISWAVIIVFTLVASISNASWQCPDGTPCPNSCSMMRAHPSAHGSRPGEAHCSRCPAETTVMTVGHGLPGCTTPRCIFRSNDRPDASISRGVTIPLASADLIPVAPVEAPQAAAVFVDRYNLGFFPQHFLRSHFGRSPPTAII